MKNFSFYSQIKTNFESYKTKLTMHRDEFFAFTDEQKRVITAEAFDVLWKAIADTAIPFCF